MPRQGGNTSKGKPRPQTPKGNSKGTRSDGGGGGTKKAGR